MDWHKILIVCPSFDFGGSKIQLCDAINKHTEHTCRHVSSNYHRKLHFKRDLAYEHNSSLVWEEAEKSDVFLFFGQDYDYKNGNWRKYLKGKKVLFNPNSTVQAGIEKDTYAKAGVTVFSHHANEVDYPDTKLVPIYKPIDDPLLQPGNKTFSNDKVTIGQSPTSARRKGTQNLLFAANKLYEDMININLDIVINTPYKECLKRKSNWDIAFDNIKDGHEGSSGWEALALGVPTFVHLDSKQEDYLKSIGGGKCMFVNTHSPQDLYWKVKDVISDKVKLETMGRKSREWVETYFNKEVILERLFSIIEETGEFNG